MSCKHCGGSTASKSVKCPLCQDNGYCSGECQKKHWSQHQVECNTFTLDDDEKTLAVPYMYQDVAPSNVLDALPENSFVKQSYLLRSTGTDATVSNRVISASSPYSFTSREPLKESLKEPLKEKSFTITIEDLDSGSEGSVRGEIPYNIIQKNSTNPIAERLAGEGLKGPMKEFIPGLEMRNKAAHVLWPNPNMVSDAFKDMPIVEDHTYALTLKIGNTIVIDQAPFGVLLSKDPSVVMSAQEQKALKQSKLGRFYQHVLKTKFNDTDLSASIDYTGTYEVLLKDGGTAILTVQHNGDHTVTLKDIEVIRPLAREEGDSYYHGPTYNPRRGPIPGHRNQGSGGVRYKIECDTSDIDHVTALSMTLKDRVAQYQDVLDTLKATNVDPNCPIIARVDSKMREYEGDLRTLLQYQRELHEKGPVALSQNMSINSLVSKIMEDQYEFIGDKMKQSMRVATYNEKIQAGGIDQVMRLRDTLYEKLKNARAKVNRADQEIAQSKGAKRLLSKGRKAKAILAKRSAEKDLEDLIEAIRRNHDSAFVTDDDLKDALQKNIDWIRDRLNETTSQGVYTESGDGQEDDVEQQIWSY